MTLITSMTVTLLGVIYKPYITKDQDTDTCLVNTPSYAQKFSFFYIDLQFT